jgi:hypothetical protein
VSELGSSPFDRLTYDLVARATSVLWCTAWAHTFEAIGDAESARELVAVLTETRSHCESLQEVLNRLVAERVNGTDAAPSRRGRTVCLRDDLTPLSGASWPCGSASGPQRAS